MKFESFEIMIDGREFSSLDAENAITIGDLEHKLAKLRRYMAICEEIASQYQYEIEERQHTNGPIFPRENKEGQE